MNGKPLPLEHGFPVRVVTSGLYGYVSDTKWLTELEVTCTRSIPTVWAQATPATVTGPGSSRANDPGTSIRDESLIGACAAYPRSVQ